MKERGAPMATTAAPPSTTGGGFGTSLDRYFHISERGSTVRTELIAGLATFLTMSYILFVNPSIIAGLKDHTGHALAFQQVLTVTALVAGIMTLLMGLYANYPFAMT